MAITAMGLGTKSLEGNYNLDPQRQFWGWLTPFIHPDERGTDSSHHERGYFSGFNCTQTSPAGLSIQIGGGSAADSALLVLDHGNCVLLSTDGEPEVVTIPTAPASGARIDAVVSYVDKSTPNPDTETPGTPEYVHTIVVSGPAASSPSAPTDADIVAALPSGASGKYYRWCDVRVGADATTITDSDITDRKPASPNVYWTNTEIEQIASDEINSRVPGLIVARAPYVATATVSGTNPNGGPYRITAPAPRSGYKFLCWVIFITVGYTANWYPDDVTSARPLLYCAADRGGSGSIIGQALYVPIS